MSLKDIDFEKLKEGIRQATILLIMVTDGYVEAMKDPSDIEHVALSFQLQEAARGEKEVYIIAFRPLSRDNFALVMDMLEGSKTKAVFFVDKDSDKDKEKVSLLLRILMGSVTISGTSKDSWITERRKVK